MYAVGNSLRSVTVGDLDGDGALDLAVASDGVSVLLNLGDGTFGEENRYAVGDRPVSVTVGDVDGDRAPTPFVAVFKQSAQFGWERGEERLIARAPQLDG